MREVTEAERLLEKVEKVKLPRFREVVERCTEPDNDFVSVIPKNPGDYSLTEKGKEIRDEIDECLMPIDHHKFANLVFQRHSNYSIGDSVEPIRVCL